MPGPLSPRLNRRSALSLLGSLAAGTLGCRADTDSGRSRGGAPTTSPAPSSPARGRRPTEVLSWWTRAGSLDALERLSAVHRRSHPEEIILNGSVLHSNLARKTVAQRIERGEPPDLFQANIGEDLMRWVLLSGLDERGSRLLPLDDLVEDIAGFRRFVPPPILATASFGGKLYGLPTNIERVNSLYVNRAVFEHVGVAPPHTVSELLKVSQELKEAGVTPLSLGTRHPWTAVMVIFECLLVAREGPAFYRDYFSGRLVPDDARVRHTLEESLALFAYANSDHVQRDWVQAVDPLFAGRAAMTIAGDWARLLFNAKGWRAESDYSEIAFPGTAGTMVFTCDTFALPVDARNKDGARLVLGTMASVEGQRAMNEVKTQLPARLDVALPANADTASREKLALAKNETVVLALSGLVPRRFSADLGNAAAEMVAARDTAPVLQTLRSRYALLKR